MEGMIGEIRMFAGNFAPKSWSFCNGNIINIASNTALFSILGTTYGGNGTTTFALPNLQGRTVVGAGQGPGLPNYALGQVSGAETATLSVNTMPAHLHAVIGSMSVNVSLPAANTDATLNEPVGLSPALTSGAEIYSTTPNGNMGPVQTTVTVTGLADGMAGGNAPFSIVSPYLSVYYIICMYGIFPSRG